MAETNTEKVLAVFDAIRAQDEARAIQYFSDHFAQHYRYIAADAEGLKQYITNSPPEHLKFTVVRVLQDGPYVVTQVRAESSGDDVFAVYRFQDGLIAEHWAFSAPNTPPNKSGDDLMIRHEPGVRDDVAEFLRDVEVLMEHRTIDEVKLLVGQGDFVFIAAKGTHEGDPCAKVDLYRVEGEKIVEHWGFPERVPPQEQRKNNNGML